MTRDQQQKGKQYNERDQLLPNIPETTINPQQTLSVGNQILSLAIPAASALLIDPLMTLADTAMVGRYSSGPEALAGMGSASALLTFSFYLFNFLCTATTPLVAQRRAANQLEQAQAVGGQAITLAWVLGACLIAILLTFRQPLLYIMGTGITGDLANGYALAFLSVRALAAPAVLSMEASTGVLRGYLDTKTPIAVLVAANLINLLLDVVLIVIMKMGPMGAAIATTTAEWISAGLFLAVLSGKLPSQGVEKRLAVVPLLSIPSWDDVKPLVVASGSVLLRTLVLQLSLSAAAAMAARGESAAAASIAAHQIGIQLWLMCSFFCDSLAAASQGLVADAIGRKDSRAVLDVSKTVFAYSVILGLSLAGLLWTGEASGMLAAFFTKDGDIRVALDEILPLIILAQPLNALVFSADGILQGASEFPYQAKAMLVSGLTAVSTFVCLEAFYEDSDRLIHVWAALIALQAMRGFSSLWKLVDVKGPINLLNRKTV
jgi:putative MATE family efflux protein